MKVYTGVGSRETPRPVQTIMKELARVLAEQGWTLRSGHAPGADQAFEYGAQGRAEIYLPWPGYEARIPVLGVCMERPDSEAYTMARVIHPNWDACKTGARALHARNMHQILGRELIDPSRFLVCWTPGATKRGGTATAITLAENYGLEIFNLALAHHRGRVERMIEVVNA